MMNKQNKISSRQLKGLMVSTIIGVGVLRLPNALARVLDRDGWIPIILTGILIIPFILMINKIFQRNPGKSFFQIGEETLGRKIFIVLMVVFALSSVLLTALVLRLLSELVKAFLLPITPMGIIFAMILIATAYMARLEIDAITRLGYAIYYITIISVVLLIVLAIPSGKATNILPQFQGNMLKIPEGIMKSIFSFMGFEVLIFALPQVSDNDNSVKSCLKAILIVVLVYLSLFVLSMTQFSIEQIKRQNFPILMIAKLIDLPGFFIQNLDTIFMSLWIIISFGTMGPTYYSARRTIAYIFNTDKNRIITLLLLPAIYTIGILPKNIVTVDTILGKAFNIVGTISIFLIPTLIFIVDSFRRRRKKI